MNPAQGSYSALCQVSCTMYTGMLEWSMVSEALFTYCCCRFSLSASYNKKPFHNHCIAVVFQ